MVSDDHKKIQRNFLSVSYLLFSLTMGEWKGRESNLIYYWVYHWHWFFFDFGFMYKFLINLFLFSFYRNNLNLKLKWNDEWYVILVRKVLSIFTLWFWIIDLEKKKKMLSIIYWMNLDQFSLHRSQADTLKTVKNLNNHFKYFWFCFDNIKIIRSIFIYGFHFHFSFSSSTKQSIIHKASTTIMERNRMNNHS